MAEEETGAPKWLREAFQVEANKVVRYKPITTLKALAPNNSSKKWTELGLIYPLGKIAAEITGSDYPYTHQETTIKTILESKRKSPKKIVLRGGTHSGKSLAFLLPALSLILEQKLDFVVIFYPMKQLIEDQFHNLKKLLLKIRQRTGRAISAKVYHGEKGLETAEKVAWDNELREIERNPPTILLATFDKVWYQLLHSERKNKLLEKIIQAQYLVFDELHSLKGLPAAYIHYFLRVHNQRNPNCQILISTATIANIQDFRDNFLPAPNNKQQKKADKVIIESNPVRGAIDVRAVPAASFLPLLQRIKKNLPEGKIALVFVDSKRKIEEYAKRLGLLLKKDQAIYDAGSIGVLHANLHQKIRKQALIDARKGKLKVIITSAVMELGIDLKNIQTIINVGWPVSGKDGLLQRIGRDRSKPGEHKVIYLVFDTENPRDQIYYSNLALVRKILKEYQCTPLLFPKENQKVIMTIIILLLIYGFSDHKELLSFFETEQRLSVKNCLTILLCHGVLKKAESKLFLMETTTREFRKLVASSIRAIASNWRIVFDRGGSRKVLGFCSIDEVLRGGLPGNILLVNKIPYQVTAVNKEDEEIRVALTTISPTFKLPINSLAPPNIRMGLFPKRRRVKSGLVYQFGEIIITRSPRTIASYPLSPQGQIQNKRLKESERKSYAMEKRSIGILVEIGKIFNDPLLSCFSEKPKELLTCLRIILKTQIELSLQIVQSEIAIAFNNSQFAIYDKGGGNGNSKYLIEKLPVIIEGAIHRLKRCNCADGCEKCFGRDFSNHLPKGNSKAILIQLLEWLK